MPNRRYAMSRRSDNCRGLSGRRSGNCRGLSGEEVQQRNCEIDRLHRVYGEEVVQRNCEIERLHTVYLEAIRERDVAIERLAAELRYVRRFRIAAQRVPGMPMLLRTLSLAGHAARAPKKACREAAALLLGGLRNLSAKRAPPKPSSSGLPRCGD